MRFRFRLSLFLTLAALGCAAALRAADTADNPLLKPSPLPYELPPFADIKDEQFAPAFDRAMAEELAEIDQIADNPNPPTFDNTLVALERSGQTFARVNRAFG